MFLQGYKEVDRAYIAAQGELFEDRQNMYRDLFTEHPDIYASQ